MTQCRRHERNGEHQVTVASIIAAEFVNALQIANMERVGLMTRSAFPLSASARSCQCSRGRRGTVVRVSAAKVNKRGKVTSRPGQPSKKELKKQAEEMKMAFQEQQKPASAGADEEEDDEEELMETPTEITDNMLQRIIIFAGMPVFLGFLMFPAFYYLRVVQDIEVPTWVVYIATGLAFGGGLAGISYGVLSASWDPRRKGSALGFTEFQANLPILMEQMNAKRR